MKWFTVFMLGAAFAMMVANCHVQQLVREIKHHQRNAMTDEQKIDAIIDILDPNCRHRYKEGDCLPRGYELSTHTQVNVTQEFRERAARAKAGRILQFFKKNP